MRIFHHHAGAKHSGPNRAYVSEFTRFIDDFMAHHPEELAEQRKGWSIYWNKEFDFHRLAEEKRDTVPTEGYYYFGDEMWRKGQHH